MAEHDNDLKPLDISKVKSATSRIDLSKATIPSSPATSGIRIGANPKKATSRIDVSAIPGAKAQTSRVGLGAMPPLDDDIYKRRTALLDTSNIPLSTTPAEPPRTIRIGARPTVRVSTAAPTTFSPGRPSESEEDVSTAAPAGGGRPTIRLKRPGGASITVSGSTVSTSPVSEPLFTIQEEEGPGAAWAVISLLSMLVIIGVIVFQVITMNASVY